MGAPVLRQLTDIEATCAFARQLAAILMPRDVVLLRGELGVGKTTLARAVIEALGVAGDIPSPTFTLVQAYDVPQGQLFHFDLYRLKVPEEIEETGFDEACSEGLVLVEWPEKALSFMPRDALTLYLRLLPDNTREVEIHAPSLWMQRLEAVL